MIAIGSDHAGLTLKNEILKFLSAQKIEFVDHGCYSETSCDYPDIVVKPCNDVVLKNAEAAILICGSGIGVCICANKIKSIRAACCFNEATAILSRQHNNANVLCLGARILNLETALKIVSIFLNTKFDGGRHELRIKKIAELENKN